MTDIQPAAKSIANTSGHWFRSARAHLRRLFSLPALPALPSEVRVIHFQPSGEWPVETRELFAKAEAQDVGFGADWYRHLTNSVFAGDPDVWVYAMFRGSAPIAAIPLRIGRGPLGRQLESLSNYYTSLYSPALAPDCSPNELSLLLGEVLRRHRPLGRVRFNPMDPDSASYGMLMQATKSVGLEPFQFFCFGNWYLPVTGDWPTYFAQRDGKLKNTVGRMGRKFAKDGGTFELITGGADLERGLDAYQKVYAASWKTPEPYVDFVPEMARSFAGRGWLRLGIASLEGKPVAAQIWIVANGKAHIYKLAYDERYRKYSPGSLLTAKLMQHAIEVDNVQEVDYLIGDDSYKQSWMDCRRERWGIVAYNLRSLSGCLGLIIELGGRSTKRIRARFKTLWQTPRTSRAN